MSRVAYRPLQPNFPLNSPVAPVRPFSWRPPLLHGGGGEDEYRNNLWNNPAVRLSFPIMMGSNNSSASGSQHHHYQQQRPSSSSPHNNFSSLSDLLSSHSSSATNNHQQQRHSQSLSTFAPLSALHRQQRQQQISSFSNNRHTSSSRNTNSPNNFSSSGSPNQRNMGDVLSTTTSFNTSRRPQAPMNSINASNSTSSQIAYSLLANLRGSLSTNNLINDSNINDNNSHASEPFYNGAIDNGAQSLTKPETQSSGNATSSSTLAALSELLQGRQQQQHAHNRINNTNDNTSNHINNSGHNNENNFQNSSSSRDSNHSPLNAREAQIMDSYIDSQFADSSSSHPSPRTTENKASPFSNNIIVLDDSDNDS